MKRLLENPKVARAAFLFTLTAAFTAVLCLTPSKGGLFPPPGGGSSSTNNNGNVFNAVVNGAATGNGSTDDTAALQSALTSAAAAGYKKLYIPAGTYKVSAATGNILSSSTAGVEIYGDGIGRTVLRFADNTTLTGPALMVSLTGSDQSVHDMSLVGGTGLNGALTATGASIAAGGTAYTQGDTLTMVGGTFSTAAQFTVNVSGGAVTSIASTVTGGSYTYAGVSSGLNATYTVTGGTGSNAKITLGGTGSPGLTGVGVGNGALRAHLYNLDISGMWGLQTSGGAGVTTFQPPQTDEASTTLGTTFGAGGSQTVTPGSMAGIYAGRTLRITGTANETIQVASVTATTFTATFASAHNSADVVHVWSLGHQYNLVENVYIHDSWQASATVMNSGENVYRGVRVRNVGSGNNQHGLYDQQGGHNTFEDCYAEGCGGFSYHVHIGTGSIADASGNRFVHCYSVNPGSAHFLADSVNGDGTDPTVPSGQALNRYVAIIGCVFKCTPGAVTPNTGNCCSVQAGGAIWQGCMFEDTSANGNGVWLNLGSNSSSVKQTADACQFRVLNATGTANTGCTVGNNSILRGCQFVGFGGTGGGTPVAVNANTGNCIISHNQIDGCNGGKQDINISAAGMNGVTVSDNVASVGASNTTSFLNIGTSGLTGLDVFGNDVTLASGAHFMKMAANNPSGRVHHNAWSGSTGGVSYTNAPTALDLTDNTGFLNFNNTTTGCLALDSQAGHLLSWPVTTNTLTGGLAANVAGTGVCATTDTVWAGFATSAKDATSGNAYIAGWAPGQVVRGVTGDGACTAGHVLQLSGTVAGNVHDSGGTTAPAAPASYGIALTTTGGAGAVDIRVMRGQ